MKPIKLIVKTKSDSYPILIGSNIIKDLALHLRKNSINFNKCLLIIDKNVPKKMIAKITRSLKRKEIFKPNKKYNLIISNILQPTLIKLSKKFEKLASNKILLSGVLEHQTDSLINSYDWIDLKIIDKLDDWTLLLGKLKS